MRGGCAACLADGDTDAGRGELDTRRNGSADHRHRAPERHSARDDEAERAPVGDAGDGDPDDGIDHQKPETVDDSDRRVR
jgi:hypothetical protein